MRLTKKILLSALLPLSVMLLGAIFSPTPPAEAALVASADPLPPMAAAQPAADLLSTAWDHARGLWLAALKATSAC